MNFGSLFSIVSVNAEITKKLSRELKRSLAIENFLIIASCEGECAGYLVSDTEYLEGGYEAGGWVSAFGCKSTVVAGASKMISELGRNLR